MKRFAAVLAMLAGTALTGGPARPAAEIRVRLFSGEQPSRIELTTDDGRTVVLDAAEMSAPFESGSPVTLRTGGASTIELAHPIEVSTRNGTLLILMRLPIEHYVAAVLAGEAAGFRSEESLKAVAVAIRTYATHFRGRHAAEGFDLCDTTHCQDFRITAVNERLRSAVEATSGEVLEYEGRPIAAYYHQDCGGVTEPLAPYLGLLEDAFCVSRDREPWTLELRASDLEAAIGLADAYAIEVVERTSSGRARRLRISGLETRLLEAEAFRLTLGRRLGWDKLPSDLYEVRPSPDGFVFEGYGAGHGIGLCQKGAAVMGEQGYAYQDILAYYYPNTRIVSTS